MRAAGYAALIIVFLGAVALASLAANSSLPAALLPVVLWLAVVVGTVVFLVWFIVTLNGIARSLREQTQIMREGRHAGSASHADR
jgi:hypothetical protein